jgi:hypothetical protein
MEQHSTMVTLVNSTHLKEEISEENDNAPVGILLVADKDHALVKYATAGMDENLFVQQYLVQLPSKAQLETYINTELGQVEVGAYLLTKRSNSIIEGLKEEGLEVPKPTTQSEMLVFAA